jgi:hypothetical protein
MLINLNFILLNISFSGTGERILNSTAFRFKILNSAAFRFRILNSAAFRFRILNSAAF